MIRRMILGILLSLSGIVGTQAQSTRVRGQVTDGNGVPLRFVI